MYLINNVFNQAVFVIGMVVFLGMLVQKTEMSKIIASTVKTMIGFLLINTGGQTLGAALLPLQPMLIKVFRLQVKVQDLGAAQAESLGDIGSEMALIFALGFLMNILLARITKFKYVHLSAHVSFFFSGLIAAALKFGTNLSFIPLVLLGAVLLGSYMTFTCAYVAPLMKNIKGGEGFTLAHSSSCGIWLAAKIGGLVGNKEKDLEDIKIPKKLNFLREMTIALTVVMTLMFFVISLISGPGWVVQQVSEGRDIISFSLLNGLQFGLWITVIITGVRMLLSEIIPAFHGIADILGVVNYPVVVFPALIPTLFTGAVTAIFGNSTGGIRGAFAGSFLNGLILIIGQALLLPMIGTYAPIMRILSETDYCLYGPLLGGVLKLLGGI